MADVHEDQTQQKEVCRMNYYYPFLFLLSSITQFVLKDLFYNRCTFPFLDQLQSSSCVFYLVVLCCFFSFVFLLLIIFCFIFFSSVLLKLNIVQQYQHIFLTQSSNINIYFKIALFYCIYKRLTSFNWKLFNINNYLLQKLSE